jgi:hypothetical protein
VPEVKGAYKYDLNRVANADSCFILEAPSNFSKLSTTLIYSSTGNPQKQTTAGINKYIYFFSLSLRNEVVSYEK